MVLLIGLALGACVLASLMLVQPAAHADEDTTLGESQQSSAEQSSAEETAEDLSSEMDDGPPDPAPPSPALAAQADANDHGRAGINGVTPQWANVDKLPPNPFTAPTDVAADDDEANPDEVNALAQSRSDLGEYARDELQTLIEVVRDRPESAVASELDSIQPGALVVSASTIPLGDAVATAMSLSGPTPTPRANAGIRSGDRPRRPDQPCPRGP